MSHDPDTITINDSNSVVTNNYQYEYQLKGSLDISNMECCLVKAFFYNSLYNVVTSQYQNNTYSYIYPNGAGFNTYNINMPDGNYSIPFLNQYLQTQMMANNTYLLDNLNNPVFYLMWNVNQVYYGVTVTSTPVPTSLPALWSSPAGAPALPSVTATPQLVIPSVLQLNNKLKQGFGYLLGFSPATYPATPQSTIYTVDSNIVPQINPQYAFNICVNLVNKPYLNTIPSMIYPFTFTVPYQTQQTIEPANSRYYTCRDGSYSSIIVSILDQTGKPAQLQDFESSFTIEIKPKDK
jgi:hypothetical protein